METRQLRKPDILVAIDPDVDRDGVAILMPATRELEAMTTDLGHTLLKLQDLHLRATNSGMDMLVLVEAGWQNKGNYHWRYGDTREVVAAKGVSQGRNHQRGLDIISWCQALRIPYREVKPLAKTVGKVHLWKGKDGKITQEEIENIVGRLRVRNSLGHEAVPNQEVRDAVLIAWEYAGLPMRVKR